MKTPPIRLADEPSNPQLVSLSPELPPEVVDNIARIESLERENAKLREALEAADADLTRLFTLLPITGPLPSPTAMQHVKHALGR